MIDISKGTLDEKELQDFLLYMDTLKEVFGENFEKLCDFLNENNFIEKCAGRKHHGTNDSDLVRHSMCVAKQLEILTKNNSLSWERPESPIIVGLLHDVCKCYNYIKDEDGNWVWNKETPSGHGTLSLLILNKLVPLTLEEQACIRYHMGAYEGKEVWGELSNAIKTYPNILWTCQADMIASKFFI